MAAITGLIVVHNSDFTPQGYIKINKDLSKGAGGDYTYLCYSTVSGLGPPITAIQVAATKKNAREDTSVQPSGYTLINEDLNNGAGGKNVYVSYTSGTSAGPITSVDVIYGDQRNVWPEKEFIRIDQDCNEDAGGKYVYIVYKH